MSYRRFRMDIAVKRPIPAELAKDIDAIKEHMLRLQHFAVKINAGKPNEENTTILEEHICNHDIGRACEPSKQVEVSISRKEKNKKNDTVEELRSVARVPLTKWGVARYK